jgi:hypothetical protein
MFAGFVVGVMKGIVSKAKGKTDLKEKKYFERLSDLFLFLERFDYCWSEQTKKCYLLGTLSIIATGHPTIAK